MKIVYIKPEIVTICASLTGMIAASPIRQQDGLSLPTSVEEAGEEGDDGLVNGQDGDGSVRSKSGMIWDDFDEEW